MRHFDNQVKNVISNKNKLNELSKHIKAISTRHKKMQRLAQETFGMQMFKGIV